MLHKAIVPKHVKCLKALVQVGADVDDEMRNTGESVLTDAVR